mgnify:CR=1 FL=1
MENYLFEKMSVPKAYMKLALPVVLSMIVSLVYNMVDTYFIALTGVQELVAGVSLVAPMFTLMIAFGDIFGLGGSSAISRLLGEKKDNEAKKTCAFCIWISLVFGLCISAILLLFRTQILGLLGVGKDTYQYANAYYTWIAIGAVSIIFSMVPSNILRTEGLAVQSMAGSIIGSIVNIIFDPIFIFGLTRGSRSRHGNSSWKYHCRYLLCICGDEEIKETDMFSIPYEGHRKKDQRYLNDRNSSIDQQISCRPL